MTSPLAPNRSTITTFRVLGIATLSLLAVACSSSSALEEPNSLDDSTESDPSENAPSNAASGCQAPTITSADYLFDESPARGTVTLKWEDVAAGSDSSPVTIRSNVNGIDFGAQTVPASARSYQPAWKIQDASSQSGTINLNFHIEKRCADGTQKSVARTFALVDPVRKCSLPDPNNFAGHESVYYRCAELWANHGAGCGSEGYLIGYGAKYAERFMRETAPRMTDEGEKWLGRVLLCLQKTLSETATSTLTCDGIQKMAYNQHPACYVDSGVCALPVLDLLRVVGTIDATDWLSVRAAKQVVSVALQCGAVYARAIRRLFPAWTLEETTDEPKR